MTPSTSSRAAACAAVSLLTLAALTGCGPKTPPADTTTTTPSATTTTMPPAATPAPSTAPSTPDAASAPASAASM